MDMPRPKPVRTTWAPSVCATLATENAMEASVRTPVTSRRLPSSRGTRRPSGVPDGGALGLQQLHRVAEGLQALRLLVLDAHAQLLLAGEGELDEVQRVQVEVLEG